MPFVGKDVPSTAAEFSHPDALIGLTVLAYRHQGLRRADFVGLINLLLEQMEQEGGPYRHRPTCRLYAQWVRLAGGAVRGSDTSIADDAAGVPGALTLAACFVAAATTAPSLDCEGCLDGVPKRAVEK